MGAAVVWVQAAYKHREAMKSIPGSRWDPLARCWAVPCTLEAAAALRCIPGLGIPAELGALLPPPLAMEDAVDGAVKPLAPMPIRVKPYAHQVAAFNGAVETFRKGGHGYAFLHEQGCGKSLTAIATAGYLAQAGAVERLLVVSPLAVVPVWEREWAAYSTLAFDLAALQGGMEQRARALEALAGPLRIALVNYEALARLEGALLSWGPDMAVCDESQRIKSPQAKQSKVMHKLGQRARFRLLLTGTPVGNTPLDLWSQYRFLDPGIFESSYYAFRNHYAVMGGYGGYEVVRYKHLDELARRAHSIAHRVTKAQALDLPGRVDQALYCTLEPEVQRAYRQLQRDKVAELEGLGRVTAAQIVTQMLRLSQLTGGYLALDDRSQARVSKAKLSLLRETLGDLLGAGEKVVVFARFRAEIRDILALAGELAGPGGVRGIWGEAPGRDYGAAVADFQEKPGVRVFVAQIQAAGAGITLHAAHTAIFYSLDYSYLNYDQAKARIHRIGQKQPCAYLHLLARGTIDEEVMAALKNKRCIAEDIVDNWRRVFAPDMRREST